MVDLSANLAHITGVPHTVDGPYLVCAEPDGEPYIARWDEGVLGPRPTEEQMAMVGLAIAQSASVAAIDAQAEMLCNQVLTPGSAQMARYQRKEGQARAFANAVIPDDPDDLAAFKLQYSAIYGEVGITAETPQAVADVIVAMADAWWAYGDAVETTRLAGKRAIMAAADMAELTAAEAAVGWPVVPG